MTPADLETRLAAWHERHFPRASPAIIFAKLGEEFGELGQALIEGDHDAAVEEAADVAIVLSYLVRRLAPGTDLFREIESKLAMIEGRHP